MWLREMRVTSGLTFFRSSFLRRQESSDFALGCRDVAIWFACGGFPSQEQRPRLE